MKIIEIPGDINFIILYPLNYDNSYTTHLLMQIVKMIIFYKKMYEEHIYDRKCLEDKKEELKLLIENANIAIFPNHWDLEKLEDGYLLICI